MALKLAMSLFPEPMNVTFCGRRDFTDAIKLKYYPGLPWWAQTKHRALDKRNTGGVRPGEGHIKMKARGEQVTCVGNERGVRAASRSWRKEGKGFSTKASRRNSPANTLDYLHKTHQISDLQNCKEMDLCCFNPRRLW